MPKFNEIAAQEIEWLANELLNCDFIGDLLTYYDPTIKEHCEKLLMRKISNEENEKIKDYLFFNCDDLLEINYGYYCAENRITLASQEEIEIDLQRFKWSQKRRDIVSRYSDVFVNDNNLGYVLTDNMRLDIVITKEALFRALISE